jgi:propionate CoA-transferase
VEVIKIHGQEWLLYKPFSIDVALLRGTTADAFGNVTMEKEAGYLVTLPMAIAAHNCGGKVIVQVERIALRGTLHPQQVVVPGILVNAVVIAKPEHHWQTWRSQYDPARSGEIRVPDIGRPPVPMGKEKVVVRRALFELEPDKVVNLGAGMSEFVSSLAWEEGIYDKITFTVEAGMIGGIPGFGLEFNTASNPDAIIDQAAQMDLYDGGGNDISCVGFAQVDKNGNINVSKLGNRTPGVGGFLNVAPRAKKRVHCGSFTAGKSEIKIKDGKMEIIKDGNIKKFVDSVNQITVSGEYALEVGQPVMFITERAVFEWTKEGLVLTEIAPGVDLNKDILQKMEFKPIIAPNLKEMAHELFLDALLNLKQRPPWRED